MAGNAGALLKFLNLLLCVLKSQVLDQHGLRHEIEGIRALADVGANELLGFLIFGRGGRLRELLGEVVEHFAFVWGHKGDGLAQLDEIGAGMVQLARTCSSHFR